MFTDAEYKELHSMVFRLDYAGYKPTVVEIPNGDAKADDEKRYAHVALKYFGDIWQARALKPYLIKAHMIAEQVAVAMEVPKAFFPDIRYGALRILDYPSGAISNRHKDFDLFTLMLYRDQSDRFLPYGEPPEVLKAAHKINRQCHLGEIAEELGIGEAAPHEVLASDKRQQSIVYFAIPDHDAVLPSGKTVRKFLNDRMARSRTEFKRYE